MVLLQKLHARTLLHHINDIIVKRKVHGTKSCMALNQFGVDLLPDSYNKVLFNKVKTNTVTDDVIDSSLKELEKFGLLSSGNEVNTPDISNLMPPLRGKNVLDHFRIIADEQIAPYLDLLKSMLSLQPPAVPTELRIEAGWVRYGFDGKITNVPYPTENCLVFDVEVSVLTDSRAVMAACVTDKAWYTWLAPNLISGHSFPANMTPDTMIPLGSTPETPKLVIGHNVSYDRIRVGDEYGIELTGTRYLDTMSLHIAYSGMTSSQRIMKMGEKNIELSARPKWLGRTSLNNLADIHEHYCQTDNKMSKDVRNSFVKCTIAELKDDIPNLLDYCLKERDNA